MKALYIFLFTLSTFTNADIKTFINNNSYWPWTVKINGTAIAIIPAMRLHHIKLPAGDYEFVITERDDEVYNNTLTLEKGKSALLNPNPTKSNFKFAIGTYNPATKSFAKDLEVLSEFSTYTVKWDLDQKLPTLFDVYKNDETQLASAKAIYKYYENSLSAREWHMSYPDYLHNTNAYYKKIPSFSNSLNNLTDKDFLRILDLGEEHQFKKLTYYLARNHKLQFFIKNIKQLHPYTRKFILSSLNDLKTYKDESFSGSTVYMNSISESQERLMDEILKIEEDPDLIFKIFSTYKNLYLKGHIKYQSKLDSILANFKMESNRSVGYKNKVHDLESMKLPEAIKVFNNAKNNSLIKEAYRYIRDRNNSRNIKRLWFFENFSKFSEEAQIVIIDQNLASHYTVSSFDKLFKQIWNSTSRVKAAAAKILLSKRSPKHFKLISQSKDPLVNIEYQLFLFTILDDSLKNKSVESNKELIAKKKLGFYVKCIESGNIKLIQKALGKTLYSTNDEQKDLFQIEALKALKEVFFDLNKEEQRSLFSRYIKGSKYSEAVLPHWNKLNQQIASNPNLKIFKLDAMTNLYSHDNIQFFYKNTINEVDHFLKNALIKMFNDRWTDYLIKK